MSMYDGNAAYDFSDIIEEEKVRKKPPKKYKKENKEETKHKAKQKNEQSKELNTAKARSYSHAAVLGYTFLVIVAVLTIGYMIYGRVQITELNQKAAKVNSDLSEAKSSYIQTEMKVEAKLSPALVEKYATEVLGMTKSENIQKEFIKLSEGDKAVIANEKPQSAGSLISNIISTLME